MSIAKIETFIVEQKLERPFYFSQWEYNRRQACLVKISDQGGAYGWGYLRDTGYKSPTTVVHYLIDNFSKNGHLLLNIGPKPDGTFPEEAKNILREVGKWLAINPEISSERMLGVDQELEWSLSEKGMTITPPSHLPCKHAVVFRVERGEVFE